MTKSKQKSILDKPAPSFLKEWTLEQFKAIEKAIKLHFANKHINTLHGEYVPAHRTFNQLGDIIGFAYTSSSEYAGYWVCNTEVYNEKFPGYHYIGFAMGEDKKGYAVLWDKDENEIVTPL